MEVWKQEKEGSLFIPIEAVGPEIMETINEVNEHLTQYPTLLSVADNLFSEG